MIELALVATGFVLPAAALALVLARLAPHVGTRSALGALWLVILDLRRGTLGTTAGFPRRLERRVNASRVALPSRHTVACTEVTVTVSERMLSMSDRAIGLEYLRENLAAAYDAHAQRQGWAVREPVRVTLLGDPRLRDRQVIAVGICSLLPVREPAGSRPGGAEAGADGGRPLAAGEATTPLSEADGNAPTEPDAGGRSQRDGIFLRVAGRSSWFSPGQSPISIGRHESNPVRIAHGGVSRVHARLVFQPWRVWELHPLSESNGTRLDGVLLGRDPVEITGRHRVELGSRTITVWVSGAP